jgi:hypothetical protein
VIEETLALDQSPRLILQTIPFEHSEVANPTWRIGGGTAA